MQSFLFVISWSIFLRVFFLNFDITLNLPYLKSASKSLYLEFDPLNHMSLRNFLPPPFIFHLILYGIIQSPPFPFLPLMRGEPITLSLFPPFSFVSDKKLHKNLTHQKTYGD